MTYPMPPPEIGKSHRIPAPAGDADPIKVHKQPDRPRSPDQFRHQRSDRHSGRMPGQLGKKMMQGLGLKPDRPAIPLLLPKAYQKILARFAALRGSELHQVLERRHAEAQSGSRPKPVAKDILARLFRMRHQGEGSVFKFVQNEIKQAKQARERSTQETKGSQGEESAKATSKKDAENFLKSNSRVYSHIQDAESPFEQILKKAFTGKWNADALPEGKKGTYATKSESGWKSFFANILLRGSVEKKVQQQVSDVMEALFRGVYEGVTVVTDLKLAQGESQMVEKFVRILIDNPDLLKAFQSLKPGDSIPKELLKLLGESLQYTKLEHQPVQVRTESGENVLQQLRQMGNQQSQSRLEQSLVQERQKRQEAAKNPLLPWMNGENDDLKNPLYYQGEYSLQQGLLKPGRPKILIIISYSIILMAVGLFGYWVSQQF